MINIIKAALFKLFKDWTFRITLIVGASLAILMNLLYLGIDILDTNIGEPINHIMCNGQNMLLTSFSPMQNFGISVPINLIVFIVGEFTYGTIRNKIIAGYKKSQIYLSLCLIGLIFTLSIMILYVGISTGLATLIGGFNTEVLPKFIWEYVVIALSSYIFITALAIFVAMLVRAIGGGLPIIIISILFLTMFGMIHSMATAEFDPVTYQTITKNTPLMFINPLYVIGSFSVSSLLGDLFTINNYQFLSGLISPIAWSIVLTVLGLLIFNKRDVK